MSALGLVPPVSADWTIDPRPTADGVELAIAFPFDGLSIAAAFRMDRAAARRLADGILAAAGDGTQRTFPKPSEAADG